MQNSVSAEFRVNREFRVDGGILCQRGNSVSTGEFHVDGGILCRRGNSVLTGISMSTGEFRVKGGIPCQRNSVSTQFRGHPTVHLVEKNFTRVFNINIYVFLFFKNAVAD
jgi:hypothetical protein